MTHQLGARGFHWGSQEAGEEGCQEGGQSPPQARNVPRGKGRSPPPDHSSHHRLHRSAVDMRWQDKLLVLHLLLPLHCSWVPPELRSTHRGVARFPSGADQHSPDADVSSLDLISRC